MSARLVGIAAALLLTIISGCDTADEVRQYTVPTEKSVYDDNHIAPNLKPDGPTPDRMLGAIVPLGRQVWFFKIVGAMAPVSAQEAAWKQFVASLRFSDAASPQPSWTLPAGWVQGTPLGGTTGGMVTRFATIRIGGSPGLEMSITSLPAPRGAPQSAVLMNVNRWRGQLQLPVLKNKFWLQETTRQTEITASEALAAIQVTLVDLAGTRDPSGGGPMMAGRGPTGRPASAAGGAPPAASDPGFSYTKPENWQPGRTSSIRRAAFTVSAGGQAVEITVFQLPASGLLANVSRWAGQIGMQPLTGEDQLSQVTSDLPVGDQVATYVELKGTQDRVTLAAILPDRREPQMAWFFKLSGPAGSAPLALAEKANFRSFVQSVVVGGSARRPAAQPPAARAPAASPPTNRPAAAAANPGFRYTQPAGWQPGRTSSIRRAAFKVSSGGQEVEITVFKLPASGLLPNVSRWAGQIGGQPLTSETQLADVVSDLTVGDQVAKFVELVGTEKRVTLAAILPDRQEPQMAWFFKLSGPAGSAALVQREKAKFRQFVQSVQLGPE